MNTAPGDGGLPPGCLCRTGGGRGGEGRGGEGRGGEREASDIHITVVLINCQMCCKVHNVLDYNSTLVSNYNELQKYQHQSAVYN